MRMVQVNEFGGPEVLELVDAEAPTPGPDQTAVSVSVVPVLFLDTQVRSGSARDWFPTTPPYVPGTGIAGEVSDVGPGVNADCVGRRVVASAADGGAYAECVVVAVDDLIEVPDGLATTEAAALLHDGRTAVGLIDQADLRAQEWVLVLGAGGGLGSLIVQLAHSAKARVIGAARGMKKLTLAQELGADAVVDYSQSDWPKQVLDVTNGLGADVVFDGVGGSIGEAAFEVTAPGGRFSAHGAPSGRFARFDTKEAKERDITARGIEDVQFDLIEAKCLTERAMSKAVAGAIKPVIGQTYPLDRVAEAHAAIEDRAVIGKTLLVI